HRSPAGCPLLGGPGLALALTLRRYLALLLSLSFSLSWSFPCHRQHAAWRTAPCLAHCTRTRSRRISSSRFAVLFSHPALPMVALPRVHMYLRPHADPPLRSAGRVRLHLRPPSPPRAFCGSCLLASTLPLSPGATTFIHESTHAHCGSSARFS
ncbi:hypothetical protein C8R45DRAFT_1181253, partial [Mycena sanguinolenta]